MCGIVGVINKNGSINPGLVEKMLKSLAHRGPEDEGLWFSDDKICALGQRRLSIIDLSPDGHQPMISSDGRYVITFNGEIYNYQELKDELLQLGRQFKSKSDTEVLLQSFVQWGEGCLSKLNGMFAFAIWDNKKKKLFAARDRIGEKPFKYYYDEDKFIFASEVKAILQDKTIDRKIDLQAIDVALSLRFVPSPMTGFENIKKLPAGHYLVWDAGNIEIKKYWDAGDIKLNHNLKFDDAKKQTWSLFLDSVEKRMISDVSIGAMLSGGLDSTSVVMAMSQICQKPIDTFVISMGGESEDQKFAKLAASYFKTNHHEIAINEIDYIKALNDVAECYDEPFFDQSGLPSLLISSYIKKHVTVVLSGDGGDEVFGGYDEYRKLRLLNHLSKLPKSFRKFISNVPGLNNSWRYKAEILSGDLLSMYLEIYATWKTSLPLSKKYITKSDLYSKPFVENINFNSAENLFKKWFNYDGGDIVNGAMVADFRGRLSDGYLTKTDMATMQHALEMRPPFLDHRLVELALSMPSSWKVNGSGKFIWREIIKDRVPQAILDRKKTGFTIPLDKIIKTDLRPLTEEILLGKNLISDMFSSQVIKKLWLDHLSGKADYSNHIWSLLMLELWIRKYQEN